MVASASPAVVARVAISTGAVMTWRTGILRSSCSPSDSRSTSRSVKIPATRRFSSMTATAPTCRSSIVRIACSTVASSGTEAASQSHISRMFIRSPLRPPPGSSILRSSILRPSLLLHSKVVLEYLAILHHKTDILKNLDIRQGVARNRDHIRVRARRDHAESSFHLQQFRGPRSRALDRLHRRHAQINHARELLRDRLGPRHAPNVSPESDLDSRLQSLAKRLFVRGGALAVALACRSAGRRPVFVVDVQSRAEPCALPDHLRDLRVGQQQAVLDRIASAVERALQAFSAVSVAGHLFAPAMSLVHNRA